MKRKNQQLSLQSFGHGGIRHGAGRKKLKTSGVSHKTRTSFSHRHPLHLTIKLKSGLPTLRTKKRYKALKTAIKKARQKGLRVIHFAILSNHVHIIAEAAGKEVLSQGMQSLGISFAKALNRLYPAGPNGERRRGGVFKDRYHMEVLNTPRQLKQALIYVFENAAKHMKRLEVFDFYSTLCLFSEWQLLFKGYKKRKVFVPKIEPERLEDLKATLSQPQTWLMSTGWKRAV